MITNEKHDELLESGLLIDHFLVLHKIKNKLDLPKNRRVQGFINLLTKKGYLEEYELTEKGIDLLDNVNMECGGEDKVEATKFSTFAQELFIKCENKLVELTGKKQVVDKINHSRHSFMPNITDFSKTLKKVLALYKIKDWKKVEKTILAHIDNCAAARSWFPTMQYYISKNNTSKMVTDMENIDEEEESTYESSHKFV